MERRKRYSRKFQPMAVESMKTSESVDELARELGVTRRCVYKWRTKLEAVEPGEEAPRPSTHASAQREEILQLKRLRAVLTGRMMHSGGSLRIGTELVDVATGSRLWGVDTRPFSQHNSQAPSHGWLKLNAV